MTITIRYCVIFGKLDSTDWSPWDIELTPDEETAYQEAVERGACLELVPELQPVLLRAGDEILADTQKISAELGEDYDENWKICVQFDN